MTLLSQMVVAGYYKKALMAICLCIALFAGGGAASGQWPGVRDQGPEVGSSVKKSLQETVSTEELFEYFNDFIVYMKDNRKKDRILVCDVVVELNRGMKLPQERIELRKIIYNTLKKPSDLHQILRSLKEEIKIALNNFMDNEIIKNVYFSKFILL